MSCTVVVVSMFIFSACGGSSSDLPPGSGSSGSINDNSGGGDLSQNSTNIKTVTVTADPETVFLGGTSDIDATVLDQSGNSVKDGTVVSFFVSDDTLGTIESSAITLNGIASVTLTVSSDDVGILTVTARSGSVTGQVDVEIVEPVTELMNENTKYSFIYRMRKLNLA